jgi:hypothetical protein
LSLLSDLQISGKFGKFCWSWIQATFENNRQVSLHLCRNFYITTVILIFFSFFRPSHWLFIWLRLLWEIWK